MPKVDISIVAGRRPDLLSETLASFKARVFDHLDIGLVLMNLDPIFGDVEDHAACVAVLKQHFPEARAFEPEQPGYGAAVQRVWQATTADYVFHLEDDWIALRDMGEELLPDEPRTAQTALHHADRPWNIDKRGHDLRRHEYLWLGPVRVPRFKSAPMFTVSPSLLRGDFARRSAALMDIKLDPEKQFYSGHNLPLQHYAAQFSCRLYAPDKQFVIKDIGRDWRAGRNIVKSTVEGTSVWSGPAPE